MVYTALFTAREHRIGCHLAGVGKKAAKRRGWAILFCAMFGSCEISFEIPRLPFRGAERGHFLLVFLFLELKFYSFWLRRNVAVAVSCVFPLELY